MSEPTFWISTGIMATGVALALVAMAVMMTTWRRTKSYALQWADGGVRLWPDAGRCLRGHRWPVGAGDDVSEELIIEAKKVQHFMFVSQEAFDGVEQFQNTMARLFEQAADPNYVPPPPWEGDPLTPKPAAYEQLLESEGLTRELVELHGPVANMVRHDGTVTWWECQGCDHEGMEAEYPYWPCETTAVIARHLGVDLAEAT